MAEHQRYLYGAEAEETPGGAKRDPLAPKHLSQPDYDRIQLLARGGDAEWLDGTDRHARHGSLEVDHISRNQARGDPVRAHR